MVLDDGLEAGVRALAFSTGGGLDFWAMADRSLDIGTVWYRGIPIAWQSPVGFRSPTLHRAQDDGGRGFNRSFTGFLVTCGLDHIRQPASGQPLHGRLPFTPARVLAYGEDWECPEPVLYCEGEIVQARYGGEALRLRRRIEAPIGGCEIRIQDTVENIGAEPTAQAMLYHFNLGYPAVAQGSEVLLEDKLIFGPIRLPDRHDTPRSVSFPASDRAHACCRLSTPSALGPSFDLSLTFATDTLPHLQLWRDLRPNVGVLALEPCTSERPQDGTSAGEFLLMAADRRRYALSLACAGSLAAPSHPIQTR
jgi:hypothetical protein